MTARFSTFALALLATVILAACVRDKQSSARDDDDDDSARPVDSSHVTSAAPSAVGANASASQGAATQSAPTTWTFDSDQVGRPPSGFSFARTGSGRPGMWVVRSVPDAPTPPNVLAQEDDDRTDYRFPVAVANAPSLRDVSVSVRCKPVSGRVDQACGIVWRYQNENNYYLARANALEDNVNFYYVQDGRRHEVKGAGLKVSSGAWHELRADMRGDHVEVYFDGAKVVDAHDARFTALGKIGVWTKADSHTLFDNLTVTNFGP